MNVYFHHCGRLYPINTFNYNLCSAMQHLVLYLYHLNLFESRDSESELWFNRLDDAHSIDIIFFFFSSTKVITRSYEQNYYDTWVFLD